MTTDPEARLQTYRLHERCPECDAERRNITTTDTTEHVVYACGRHDWIDTDTGMGRIVQQCPTVVRVDKDSDPAMDAVPSDDPGNGRERETNTHGGTAPSAIPQARFEDNATASRFVFDIDDIADRMMGMRFSPADTERINDAALRLSRVVVKGGLYATSHGGPSDAE